MPWKTFSITHPTGSQSHGFLSGDVLEFGDCGMELELGTVAVDRGVNVEHPPTEMRIATATTMKRMARFCLPSPDRGTSNRLYSIPGAREGCKVINYG